MNIDISQIVAIVAGVGAIIYSVKSGNRILSAKIDSVENKLSTKINSVCDELKIIDRRLTRIETYIEFSTITSSKETKTIKPRKPRAKKNIQITMKEPQSTS